MSGLLLAATAAVVLLVLRAGGSTIPEASTLPDAPAAADGLAAPPASVGPLPVRPPAAGQAAPAAGSAPAWETGRGFLAEPSGPLVAQGRVVRADGQPAGGALVWRMSGYRAVARDDLEAGQHDFFLAAVRADAEGRYRFGEDQWPGGIRGDILLARLGEEVALAEAPADCAAPCVLPDLTLGPALVVRTELRDTLGRAVAGAAVVLKVPVGTRALAALQVACRSDAEGRAEFPPFPDAPEGKATIVVRHLKYPDSDYDLDLDAVRRGETVRFVIPAPLTLRGRLEDWTGVPPVLVELRVVAPSSYNPHSVLRGARASYARDGQFEAFAVLPESGYFLVFLGGDPAAPREGWAPERDAPGLPYVLGPFHAPAGDSLDLGRVRLPEPSALRGSVVDGSGTPVSGARVVATPETVRIGQAEGVTDARGWFAIDAVPPGSYRVSTSREFPGLGVRVAEARGVTVPSDPIELRLSGHCDIVVRFHPRGRPSEALLVKSARLGTTREGSDGWRSSGSSHASVLRQSVTPGKYKVTVTARGYAPVDLEAVEVFPDRETILDVELDPVGR